MDRFTHGQRRPGKKDSGPTRGTGRESAGELLHLARESREPGQHCRHQCAARPGAGEKRPQPRWEGSPYLGLETFDESDAAIFFGRDHEVEALVARLRNGRTRLITVVGASGSGKSSLVTAGLVPKLRAGAVPGSMDWAYLRFTPAELGTDPFLALAVALRDHLRLKRPAERAEALRGTPARIEATLEELLADRPLHAEAFLFVDQFEELFGQEIDEAKARQPFIELLVGATSSRRVRVVLTVRADFYHRMLDYPALAAVLRDRTFPLAAPDRSALYGMIQGPAERAGLGFEGDLVDRIVNDTCGESGVPEPGALALVAFTLKQLYETRDQKRAELTLASYQALGADDELKRGVHGAIGTRAEEVFAKLGEPAQRALPGVFGELVNVDERGNATRRRVAQQVVTRSPAASELVSAFLDTHTRLLVSDARRGEPMVQVAHEALFRSWPRLRQWIGERADDLRLRRQVEAAAQDWVAEGRPFVHLWPHERLGPVYAAFERLGLELHRLDDPLRTFVRSEAERLTGELENPDTGHYRRAEIGDRLAQIDDPRLGVGVRADGAPELDADYWVPVPGGEVALEDGGGSFTAESCHIARYALTYRQYRAFVEADDGYRSKRWWDDLKQEEQPGQQYRPIDNCPAENVSWYDAMAYCRWVSKKLGYAATLPTEQQWLQAATGGDSKNAFPWGRDWDVEREPWRANTSESRLGRTTAVGMYPNGQTPQGIFDMAGNVEEWCLNKYDEPRNTSTEGTDARVLRGGSWINGQGSCRAAYRSWHAPYYRNDGIGFRLCLSSPIVED